VTQIDFYILADQSPMGGALFACKLADKAYHLKHTIYVYTANQSQAQQMDELLWTFNPNSFLPHAINAPDMDSEEPILIGCPQQASPQQTNRLQTPRFHDVLINLDQTVPAFFGQFERVAEIVSGDDNLRNQARQRYKYYRDRGYSLNTHNIG
jgi:DNA polymerase-3 subunit chi